MIMEGQYTNQIYTLIKDQEYVEAIKILNIQLESNPRSRAALSLLGYCNYLNGIYDVAAEMYEQLTKYYTAALSGDMNKVNDLMSENLPFIDSIIEWFQKRYKSHINYYGMNIGSQCDGK